MVSLLTRSCIPYGLAVRIPGFHPGGPGSTPGMGTPYVFVFFFSAELHVLLCFCLFFSLLQNYMYLLQG